MVSSLIMYKLEWTLVVDLITERIKYPSVKTHLELARAGATPKPFFK